MIIGALSVIVFTAGDGSGDESGDESDDELSADVFGFSLTAGLVSILCSTFSSSRGVEDSAASSSSNCVIWASSRPLLFRNSRFSLEEEALMVLSLRNRRACSRVTCSGSEAEALLDSTCCHAGIEGFLVSDMFKYE